MRYGKKICRYSSFNELLCLVERVELAHVHQAQVLLLVTHKGVLLTVLQVEINDGEAVGHLAKEGEHAG